jgi:hypothetical protein
MKPSNVTLTVGERTYTVRFDTNALASLEQLLGTSVPEIFKRVGSGLGLMVEMRAILWAGLRRHHAGITLEQAGDLIDEAGGVGDVFTSLRSAIRSAIPGMEEEPADPLPAVGTGPAS